MCVSLAVLIHSGVCDPVTLILQEEAKVTGRFASAACLGSLVLISKYTS